MSRSKQARLGLETLEGRDLPSATIVADVLPGTRSSAPRNIAAVNGSLYFSATTAKGDLGVYRSDGTAGGTTLLKKVGPAEAVASDYTPLGIDTYFSAYGSLWKIDGATDRTKEIALVSPTEITAMDGKLYFAGSGSAGVELYVSDGTANGTKLLKDLDPGVTRWPSRGREGPTTVPHSSYPRGFVVLGSTLLFTAANGLWKSDGTSAGTVKVADLAAEQTTVMNGAVYFTADGALWRTDGTAAGTSLLRPDGAITELTVVNDTLFFRAIDPVAGPELWKSDGTASGTTLVKSINASDLTAVGGTLYFSGKKAASGKELWTSDGTAAGTVLVKDVNPGAASSSPANLTNVNGLLYFTADDGTHGVELWESDGTAAGTKLVRDIYPGATGSNPAYLVGLNNKLYFAATDPQHGRELWDPPPVAPMGQSLRRARDVAQVRGAGLARLTDPDGRVFPLVFGLTASLHSDGTASGAVSFVFGPAFGQAWGAVPGVDAIHLHGKVTSFTVAADGTITLQGQLTEKDFSRRDGVVFVEENVPFEIVVRPNAEEFTLQWCELPTYSLEVIAGDLGSPRRR